MREHCVDIWGKNILGRDQQVQKLRGGCLPGMCEEQQNSKVASGKGAIETGEGTRGHIRKSLKGHWKDSGLFSERNAMALKGSEQESNRSDLTLQQDHSACC